MSKLLKQYLGWISPSLLQNEHVRWFIHKERCGLNRVKEGSFLLRNLIDNVINSDIINMQQMNRIHKLRTT
jgi:hypothetical protein